MGLKLLIVGLIWVLSSSAAFAVPYELSYGGRLTESNGKPVSGPVNLRVTFFRSLTGSDQVAVALPDFGSVTLQEGIFQVAVSLSAADFHTLFNGVDEAFIQIEDLSHGVTYPRQKFAAVPYALKVPVDGQSITYNANGKLSLGNGANTLTLPAAAGAANKLLKSDGAGGLIWADDLSGGGAGTVTSTEIQDGSITNDDISGSAGIVVSKISGLGGAATKSVGTGAGDVAAGSHTHTMSAVTDAGTLATKNAVGSADITDGTVTGTDIASGTITDANINATANISYLKISGLGGAASKSVGTAAGEVAAGDHGHTNATTGAAGFMSAGDKTKLDGIASGAGVDTNGKTLCADGEFLRGEDATTCRSAVQIVGDGGGVKTSDTGTVSGTMIADNAIANAKIANGAVDNAKVANGAIDLTKLSATICAANQVLKMNSGGTALTCATITEGGGSYAAKSADYTVTTSDNDKLLDVTNQTTMTLPAAATAGAGFRVTVKRSGTALVRIMPDGAETIDGQNVGVILAITNTSVSLLSSGSSWVIASKDGIYARSSAFSDLTCGGASDYCYDDATAMAAGYALTPGGKALEYTLTPSGFKVWKEIGGSRVLKPTGADSWALKLNANGKGFSAAEFTDWTTLAGRVCPTNVYIDDSNKFTTGNCLYYTTEPGQTLDASGTDDIDGMNAWATAKWYVGNVKACSIKGMRLPTLYETTITDTSTTYRPTSDGTPTYAQATGIPSLYGWTWTASASTIGSNYYWVWSGTGVSYNGYSGSYGLRCAVP